MLVICNMGQDDDSLFHCIDGHAIVVVMVALPDHLIAGISHIAPIPFHIQNTSTQQPQKKQFIE